MQERGIETNKREKERINRNGLNVIEEIVVEGMTSSYSTQILLITTSLLIISFLMLVSIKLGKAISIFLVILIIK